MDALHRCPAVVVAGKEKQVFVTGINVGCLYNGVSDYSLGRPVALSASIEKCLKTLVDRQEPTNLQAIFEERTKQLLAAIDQYLADQPYPYQHEAHTDGQAGWARVQLETARGTLIHEVKVLDGTIVDYQIEAPTDRLFQQGDALARCFEGHVWQSHQALDASVNLAILALDPCLPYQLEWMEPLTDA